MQLYVVYGSITFPLQLTLRAESPFQAFDEAHSIINPIEFRSFEMELHMKNNKTPIITGNCIESINWSSVYLEK
ncbi:hypothetical protein EBB07_28960 [Paenibacillaceae bacterium]|nr:hypothetical protein EBB07_28960 [Paenibacillaceae bacterium]